MIDADQRDLRLALAIIPDLRCLSWRKDGLQLAVGTASGRVHLCDPRVGKQGEIFPLSYSPIHTLKWGLRGLFVRSAQGDLALWNEREAQACPYQPASPSSAFVLNPQGTRLATVQSGKVTLVNL